MATTKAILNLMETPVTTEVPFLVRADMDELASTTSSDGNTRERIYQYTGGDEDFPMSLRMTVYSEPEKYAGLGKVTITCRIDTFAQETDDTSGEVLWEGPASCRITTSVPGRSGVVDSADFLALLGNAYSAFYATVDVGNVPETDVVDKLKNKIPRITA